MSERSIIALVMQTHDNSLTLYTKKRFGRIRVTSRQGHGTPNPTWIPVANEVMRRAAEKIDGFPMGTVGEIFRSEEHTSELQSLMRISYAGFCLKKKKQ